jgi:hypothetical protein
MTWTVQHISQTINAPVVAVVTVAGDPVQLPRWAAGLSAGVRLESGRWLTDSPMGTVEIRYVGPTQWGILDHDVTFPDRTVVHNPLRVLRNDQGSEVVFSLFKRPGMTDDEFDADAQIVREDLARLKNLFDGE